MGHESRQVPDAHGICVPVVVAVEMVVVSPVTAQPVVVIVTVEGEQVSVVDVEPPDVIEVVSQRTVTRRAVVVVDEVHVEEDVVVVESVSEFVSDD